MVVDTSALIAILLGEPDASRIASALRIESGSCFISAATLVECHIVILRSKGTEGVKALKQLIEIKGIIVEAFSQQFVEPAYNAYKEYGKGSGHTAGLNLGDCFAYALAKHRNDALLCKGNDFVHTDLKLVKY